MTVMPSGEAVAEVMRDLGMDELQAINHLRGREAARAHLAQLRRESAATPIPRTYMTGPFLSYLPPATFDQPVHKVWLRVYGSGRCALGEGGRSIWPTQAEADRRGRVWAVDGIAPADQDD